MALQKLNAQTLEGDLDVVDITASGDITLTSTASFKIPSLQINEIWNKLISYLICENIQKDIQDRDSINGISISPKKEFNIIKIWFKNNINDLKSINFIEPYITDKNGRTKKNIN